jgi:1,4-alpha-glucan branching enzyme
LLNFNQKQQGNLGKILALAWICWPAFCFGQTNLPLGAIVNKTGSNVTGVTFRVWAPNATNVEVRGPFNTNVTWGPANTFGMTKDNGSGYWTVTITNARPGQEYKYVLKRSGSATEYWKQDPRAVWVRNGNTVIYDHSAFDWGTVTRPNIPVSQQVMYEMHIGSFYDPNPSDGRPGTFDDAILRLDYLQRLGVNVLAVMPVNEFGGDYSWGYNPEHVYAIESAYGGPDGLKRFVKAALEKGMKLQIDVVHNHYNPPNDGLWDFDGPSNLYFYTDGRSYTPWGSRPDYDKAEVRRYIQDSVKLLLDEFRVDGFRWDSPQNILGYDTTQSGANPNTVLPNGKSMMMAINRMIHEQYPGRWSIAEDADLLSVNVTYSGFPGAEFYQGLVVGDAADSYDGHWQTSFHNTITPEIAKTNPVVGLIRGKVTEWSEPPGYRVIFTDNHDKSGILNGETRLANRMAAADPTGKTARKKTLLNAVLTLTAPGTPMLWMGQEFHATGPFSDSVRMGWREASAQHRIFRAHRDLIDLRETLPALQNSDLDASTGFINDELDLMAYWRLGVSNEDNLVVLFNFSNQDRTIGCPFPTTGIWHVQFNSDWGVYGSDFGNVGPTNNSVTANFVDEGSSVQASVPVAAHSVVVLAKTAPPAARLTEDLDSDGLADGWEDLTGITDPTGDADNDGVSNLREYELGFDPNEADPTTVVGDFNGWNATSAGMRTTSTPSLLHYLYVTESAAPGQEMKFLFSGTFFGTSSNAAVASVNDPGNNIAYNAPERGYTYFTFNTETKAYSTVTFTPTSRVDSDNNGMDDRWEAWHGVTDPNGDPDGDGFTNVQEFQRGSHPTVWNRAAMGMAGLNGNWTANANPLVYFWHNSWRLDLPFGNRTTGQFKFTSTAGGTTTWWGDIQPDGVADDNASDQQNIIINFNQGGGIYRFQFNEASSAYQITYDATDANADGIQDAWVTYYGLSGSNALATADPDGDGWSNLAELNRGTSPTASNPKRMSLVGEGALPVAFWNPAANNMTWSDARNQWEWAGTASSSGNAVFKFAQGPGWGDPDWGTDAHGNVVVRGENITNPVLAGNRYRIAFNDVALTYALQSFPVSAEWREVNGLPSAGAWTNDTDKDGVVDLLEYALGGSPTNGADGKRLQTMANTNGGGTNRLVLQWLQRTDGGSSLAITPELTTDLAGSWSPLTASNAGSQSNVPTNHVRKEVSTPQDGSKKFLRLKVSGP